MSNDGEAILSLDGHEQPWQQSCFRDAVRPLLAQLSAILPQVRHKLLQ
jgi:hypothetical protein